MARVPYVHVDTVLRTAAPGDVVVLDAADVHHLGRVLRLPDGAAVELADGTGASAHGHLTGDAVRIAGPVASADRGGPTLTVAQALTKGRKVDEVVRQVTELGADRIVPVAAARSVARLGDTKAAKAAERWRAVARAACEQARRPTRPDIAEIVDVATLAPRGGAVVLVAEPCAGQPLHEIATTLAKGQGSEVDEVVIAVGPEGGWSDDELATLVAAGATPVRLGPHVLRTEHAAAAALAIVASATGRWP